MAVIHRNEVGWHMECENCGKVFDSRRKTAQFCQSSCRTAHHREIVKHEQRLRAFQQEAANLVKHMKQGKMMRAETRKALERASLTIQRWNTDPSNSVQELSVFGWSAFEFDAPTKKIGE